MYCQRLKGIRCASQKIITLLIFLLLAGCYSIGPRQINLDRARYNDIVRDTDQAQLLKNIVRLRYLEPTYYLKVSSVTASYNLNSALSANPSWTGVRSVEDGIRAASTTWFTQLTSSISYSDSPTISYTPIDSADFVSSLLEPVGFGDISLLFRGGVHWPKLLFRLLFDQVGDLDNASFSTSAGVTDIPYLYIDDYKKYHCFVTLLDKLLSEKKAALEPINYKKQQGIMIHFSQNGLHSPEVAQLKKLLNLSGPGQDIALMNLGLTSNVINHSGVLALPKNNVKNIVLVKFRSIYGIMTFLSNSVQVPQSDIIAHRVRRTKYVDGRYFNWEPLLDGIMKIYSCDVEPSDAFVKTKYNQHWFFIRSSDLNSKTTFSLLARLLTLTAGQANTTPQASPLLTLPVNARSG